MSSLGGASPLRWFLTGLDYIAELTDAYAGAGDQPDRLRERLEPVLVSTQHLPCLGRAK